MSIGKRLTNEEALERIHKKCKEKNVEFIKFDNDENTYINNKTHLVLKCKKCGLIFRQKTFANFLKNENFKCPKCCKGRIRYSEEELSKILNSECEKRNLMFLGFTEDYKGGNTHFKYKCKKCGHIGNTLTYNNFHRKKRGCISCAKNKPYTESSIKKEIEKVCSTKNLKFIKINSFNGNKTKLDVKCNKCGKIWKNVIFSNLQKENRTCVHCKQSSLERYVENILIEYNFEHNNEKTFSWLTNKEKNKLKLDFYLPKYNIAIECQGEQHFCNIGIYGGEKGFLKRQENDLIKNKKCKLNGVKIIYFSNTNSPNYFLKQKMIKNKTDLIKEITSYEEKN